MKPANMTMNTQPTSQQPASKPRSPYVVMLTAIVLPGMGQVLNNTPSRGLFMLFFMLCLAVVSYQLTTPDHSVIGRFAGGLFIYSISVMDAYKWARVRYEVYHAKAAASNAS